MESDQITVGEKYLSAKEAAKIVGYTSDYVGQLCRSQKIKCKRIGRSWFVDKNSILGHLESAKIRAVEIGRKSVSSKFVPIKKNFSEIREVDNYVPLSYFKDERDLLPKICKFQDDLGWVRFKTNSKKSDNFAKMDASSVSSHINSRFSSNSARGYFYKDLFAKSYALFLTALIVGGIFLSGNILRNSESVYLVVENKIETFSLYKSKTIAKVGDLSNVGIASSAGATDYMYEKASEILESTSNYLEKFSLGTENFYKDPKSQLKNVIATGNSMLDSVSRVFESSGNLLSKRALTMKKNIVTVVKGTSLYISSLRSSISNLGLVKSVKNVARISSDVFVGAISDSTVFTFNSDVGIKNDSRQNLTTVVDVSSGERFCLDPDSKVIVVDGDCY